MPKEFGERLRELRNEKGVSLKRVAETTGISEDYLLKVENGDKKNRFSFQVIQKIAESLNVNVERLIDFKEE
jgi:transcriptional regulator with XRE-family HTH domain